MSNQDKWLDDMAGYSILFPEAAKRLKAHVESQRKELEELREEVQAGNLSLGYANEIIAKCEQEIKQYRELCRELVEAVEYYANEHDAFFYEESSCRYVSAEKLVAKAKERLK